VPTQSLAGAKVVTVRNPDPLHPGTPAVSAGATLTVTQPQFTLTPNPLLLRQMESGTMTISIPFIAPAGGVTAVLINNDPLTVTVPAAVTIPVGASSATFMVSALDTSYKQAVTVQIQANQANWIGASSQVTVRQEPTVNLTPTSVISGQGLSFTLTVSLTDPAPVGGLSVVLSDSAGNLVNFPKTVTVPAGATQAQVTVVSGTTGSTTINAAPSAGQGFFAGDSSAVTVKSVRTFQVTPLLSPAVVVYVGAPPVPAVP
jgi:hypothetical protein